MKWDDKYAIGIQRIDKQHRMIFRAAEDSDRKNLGKTDTENHLN